LLKEKPGEEDSEGFQRRASKAVLISNQIPILSQNPQRMITEKNGWLMRGNQDSKLKLERKTKESGSNYVQNMKTYRISRRISHI